MSSKAKDESGEDSAAKNKGTKRKELDEDEPKKKEERRAANRKSAFQSRQRRKILIDDLQRTVSTLSKDNTELRNTNNQLQAKLETAMLENRLLRKQAAAAASGGGGVATGAIATGGGDGDRAGSPASKPMTVNGGPAGTSAADGPSNPSQVGGIPAAVTGAPPPSLGRGALSGFGSVDVSARSGAFGGGSLRDLNQLSSLIQQQQVMQQGLAAGGGNAGLQQQIAMLLGGIGGEANSNICGTDLSQQQQLALLQAALRHPGGGGLGMNLPASGQNAGTPKP